MRSSSSGDAHEADASKENNCLPCGLPSPSPSPLPLQPRRRPAIGATRRANSGELATLRANTLPKWDDERSPSTPRGLAGLTRPLACARTLLAPPLL